MAFFVAAFALVGSVLLWGFGLAWLATPRRWRMLWPLFIAPCGLALQAAVVWAGAHTDLAGTDVYGRFALILPLVLLGLAWWRRGAPDWRAMVRLRGVGLVMLAVLLVVAGSMSSASRRLTSFSLGSCDAADYAAGARVFREFASGDREGFMGLTEVVRILSVDNFYDYWVRLNHFTPSGIAALNATLLGREPFELISLLGGVFLVLGVPVAFLLARSALRIGSGGSLAVSTVYGFSPLLWYAVAHVALSQLVAAVALGLLTWSGVVLWRAGATWRRGFELGILLVVAYTLLLGAYNFLILFCLLPAAAFAVGWSMWAGTYARLGRWWAGMLAPLAVSALLMPERVAGLAERFLLLRQYNFGWKIPALSPEGWVGIVGGVLLQGYDTRVRWVLSGVVTAAFLIALAVALRRRRAMAFLALCLTVPILSGYAILLIQARAQGTNASYDAYKLLAAFYPGVLAGLCFWLVHLRSRRRLVVALTGAGAIALVGANLLGSLRFAERLRNPPYLVDRGLASLQAIESAPEVTSINLRVADFWSRLWANSFLLRKPHYFPTHTYEGRLNTPLRGEWDLLDGVISVVPPEPSAPVKLERPYSLVWTRSPHFISAHFGEGWYEREQIPRANARWHWTKGDAEIVIENPQSGPLDVAFRFQARSVEPRNLEIWINGRRRRTVSIGTELEWVRVPSIRISPGTTSVQLRSPTPPTLVGPNDRRPLGFAAYGIEVKVLNAPDRGDE
jgi:hypothetical protein